MIHLHRSCPGTTFCVVSSFFTSVPPIDHVPEKAEELVNTLALCIVGFLFCFLCYMSEMLLRAAQA
jgi:hypothetical protein